MTKEETLDMIIDDYKNGSQSAMEDYCNGTRCDDCPFDFNDCMNDVAKTLTERLLKAEEHQETNFDHYIRNYILTSYNNEVTFRLKDGWKESACETIDFREWLKSPYEEPKTKYKLSKFEYDLLECYHSGYAIKDFWQLEKMLDKGYFKDIPNDVQIEVILDNCEVVEDDR